MDTSSTTTPDPTFRRVLDEDAEEDDYIVVDCRVKEEEDEGSMEDFGGRIHRRDCPSSIQSAPRSKEGFVFARHEGVAVVVEDHGRNIRLLPDGGYWLEEVVVVTMQNAGGSRRRSCRCKDRNHRKRWWGQRLKKRTG